MRFTFIATLVLVVLCFSDGFAQVVSGVVTDRSNGERLIGVNIYNQDNVGVSTDIDGKYSLSLKEGVHTITFKFIGYETIAKQVTLKPGENMQLDLKLSVESTTLDLVVVTGSQFEKKVSDEMVTVDVVKNYLVENTAAPDLKGAVGKVPGVTILDGQASIRGGGGYSYGVGSRVQLVIDDVPLLTGDLKDIQWSAIPMETTEQIEVVKGSSSVLYGSGAMNGVIHVRTGWASEKPETHFRIYQGLYTNPKVEEARWWDKSSSPILTGAFFSHRQKVKNVDIVVGAHASSDLTYLQRGHRQAVRGNWKTRVKCDKVKGLSYGLNGSIQYQQSGRFTLWANNTDGAYRPLDGTSSTDKYMFVNVDPWIQYSGEKVGLHALRARYYRVERRDDSWEDPSASNVMFFDYRFQNEFKYGIRLTTGIQYQYIWSYSILYPEQGNIISHNPAAFAQIEKTFIDRISILLGLRHETYKIPGLVTEYTTTQLGNAKLPFIFRMGSNFRVAKKTNIRASFGQAYRFPSIGEKYIDASLGPLKILPNDQLRSESGWSAELAVKQGFRVSSWHSYVDFALFWTEFRDMVEYQFGIFDGGGNEPILGFKPFNVSKARVAGVEFGLTGDGNIGPIPVRVFLGYTFNYPADLQADTTQENVQVYIQNFFTSISNSDSLTATESILKYRITNVFKADIEFDLWKFTVGYSCEYNSYINRIDAEFETFLPGFSDYRQLNDKGIWRMDARLMFNISKHSQVGLIAKNFLNEFYSVRPGIMEAPRSFTLQYSLKI
ncbi:MAG: TonB-dependent receptor [Bacteroidetes bacterium]|nr:MAG: TonB-dependent receptor [Bacteroidota bacterium]